MVSMSSVVEHVLQIALNQLITQGSRLSLGVSSSIMG